jgi:hypothetical protein
MKTTTDRILTAIFCDDIRHELGNKLSFMGCYQGELHVPATPIGLSKLCVYVTVLTPIARPFKSLALRVVLDGQTELARLEIPADALSGQFEVEGEMVTLKSISTALMFSPFLIEKATTLRVMADTEEGAIIGPRLLIRVFPELTPVPALAAEAKPVAGKVAPKKTRKKKMGLRDK